MVELADTRDLGFRVVRRAGSSPVFGTQVVPYGTPYYFLEL